MKVFISYSTKDKAMAGGLCRQLASHEINGFLAHETIKVSADWEKILIKELREAGAIIALISKAYRRSAWAGHEMGFFFAKLTRKKAVIPISLDGTKPAGIFRRIQAKFLPLKANVVPMDLWLKPLVDARPDQLIPVIIRKLEVSNVARTSETYMDILSDHFKGMSSSMLNDLVAAVIKNPCVHNAYECHDTYIPNLVSTNRKRLPQSAINRLQERLDGDPTCGKKAVLETSLMKE